MYIYCGTCRWSQDTFWTRRYNLVTILWQDIKFCGVPRKIKVYYMKNCSEGTVFQHSWAVFVKRSIPRFFKVIKNQKWWTYNSWLRAHKKNGGYELPCPKCKSANLGLD